MANAKTSIEIDAKGEFSQLTRGLKDVQSALKSVTDIVDKGAKGGGMFSEKDVKALDIFSKRFQDSMKQMNRLMDDQAEKITTLYQRRRSASRTDINTIDQEIKKHAKYLDQLEQERKALDNLYSTRKKEAAGFGGTGGAGPTPGPGRSGGGTTISGGRNMVISSFGASALTQLQEVLVQYLQLQDSPINQERLQRFRDQQHQQDNGSSPGNGSGGGSGNGGGSSEGGTSSSSGLGTLAGKLKGLGGKLAAIAGVGMTIGQVMQWEQQAEQNTVGWQNFLQRNPGANQSGLESVGVNNGYDSTQTLQALDVYSQLNGTPGTNGMQSLAQFSRAYGLDLSTTAAIAGQAGQLGFGAPSSFLSSVAGSAQDSGMSARILEVLQSSLGFLQSMDKSLKNNNGNSLLAYTTRINQIGQANGMNKLMGANGADLLQQMGNNIFNPQNAQWQALGMSLLGKYGGAGTSDPTQMMMQWQEGFQNPNNMGVLSKFFNDPHQWSGMSAQQAQDAKTWYLQAAMGGDTTLQQAQQFGQATNWLSDFNPNDPKMKQLLQGISGNGSIVSGANKFNSSQAGKIEYTNAQFTNATIDAGKLAIPAKLTLEGQATSILASTVNLLSGQTNNLGSTPAATSKINQMLGISPNNSVATNLTNVATAAFEHPPTSPGAKIPGTDSNVNGPGFRMGLGTSEGWAANWNTIVGGTALQGLSVKGAGYADVPTGTRPKNSVQQQVLNELVKKGKEAWWGNVQWLVGEEDSSWNPSLSGAKDPQDGQTPMGLFQFKPGTWKALGFSGLPSQASPATQTDAFIKRMEGAWGGNFNNIPGFGKPEGTPNGYHGWANGGYVAKDQAAIIHGGEEIISRANTQSILGKTGMLPSQVLNRAMSMSGGVTNSTLSGGASSGQVISVNINLTSDQHVELTDAQVRQITGIAQYVFQNAANQMQRQNVVY